MAFEKDYYCLYFFRCTPGCAATVVKKYRVSSFKDISVKNLKIISKLSLTRNSELFVILAGSESFLITVTKNCSPTVTSLSLEVANGIKQEHACD